MGLFSPPQPVGEQQNTEVQSQVPMYQQASDLGKEMLDAYKINYKIYLAILGYAEIPGGLKKVGKPKMSEDGAADILTTLNSLHNANVYLSKITDEDVVRIIRDLWTIVIRKIIENKENWELSDDIGDWSMIRKIIVEPIYLALRRAEGATEKGFFADTYSSKNVQNTQVTPIKKSYFN